MKNDVKRYYWSNNWSVIPVESQNKAFLYNADTGKYEIWNMKDNKHTETVEKAINGPLNNKEQDVRNTLTWYGTALLLAAILGVSIAGNLLLYLSR